MNMNTCRKHSPHPICWANGVADRWINAAAVDPETGLLTSAFVQKKVNRFNEFSMKQMVSLEKKLADDRLRAAELVSLMKQNVPAEPEEPVSIPSVEYSGLSSAEQGCAARAAAARAAVAKYDYMNRKRQRENALRQRAEYREELVKIYFRIRQKENLVKLKLDLQGDKLKDHLYSYAHGALSRAPVLDEQICGFDFETRFATKYRCLHADEDAEIFKCIHDEEEENHVSD